MIWKQQKCTKLSVNIDDWLLRIQYIKQCIRQILNDFNITSYQEDVFIYQNIKADFYLQKYKLAIKIVDVITGNSDKSLYGLPIVGKLQPYNNWLKIRENTDIRLVHFYETNFFNPRCYGVYRNIIAYTCGLVNPIYARNTKVVIRQAKQFKQFYDKNNIAGYKQAKKAFVLLDKKTEEPLMAYTCGHAFFGKGNFDLQITRGGCVTDYNNTGIGVRVIGGASKLWKAILNYYQDVKTIVYYVDSRYYDSRSISHLMDSNAMNTIGEVKLAKTTPGFMNFWVSRDQGKTYLYQQRNREPMHHKWVMQQIKKGWCYTIPNPGTSTFVFTRKDGE